MSEQPEPPSFDPGPDPSAPHNPYLPPQAELLAETSYGEEPGQRPVPFEDLEAIPGFWARIGAMFGLAFQRPSELFDRVPVTEGLGAPWRFNLLMSAPYLAFMALILGLFMTMGNLFGAQDPKLPKGFMAAVFGGELVAIAIFMAFGMFIWGLVLHLCLWIWGATREGRGLHQTLRGVGYATGFLNLVMVVPILGPLAALVGWVFMGIGLARVHRTDTWRGVCGVFTPPFLCCCGYILIIAAVVGIAAATH